MLFKIQYKYPNSGTIYHQKIPKGLYVYSNVEGSFFPI